MRISDQDRNRAVEELRRHCAAGRLAIDDYATRVAEALGAQTLAELDRVLRDLPRMSISDPSPRPPLLAPVAGDPGPAAGGLGPWASRLVLLVSVAVMVVGLVFVVAAQWVWAVILVVAWLAGVVQGRVPLRRRG